MKQTNKISGPVFVTGATGFTGREVVRLLCEDGVDTVAHVRPDSKELERWEEFFGKMGARVDTTAWDLDEMTKTMKRINPSHVYILIGTTKKRMSIAGKMGEDPKSQSYENIDYGLTALLVEAVIKAEVQSKMVYLSAAGAGKEGVAAYSKWCCRAEQAVIKSGLPYAIARPSLIVGPDRDDHRPGEMWGARIINSLLALVSFFGFEKMRDRY